METGIKILNQVLSKDDTMMYIELLIKIERHQYIGRFTPGFERKFICTCDTLDLLHDILKNKLLDFPHMHFLICNEDEDQEKISVNFGGTWWTYLSDPGKIPLSKSIDNEHLIIFLTSAKVSDTFREYFINAGDAIICGKNDIVRSIEHEVEFLDILFTK